MFNLEKQAREEQWTLQEFIFTLRKKYGKSHADQFLVAQGYFSSIEAIEEWLNRDWFPDDATIYMEPLNKDSYRPS